MNLRKVIVSLYIVLIAGLGVTGAVLFKDANDEFSQLKQVEASNRRRLAEEKQRLDDQERVLQRLRSDPQYVDRVIRMKLGYAKPDEYIYRFENDGANGSAAPLSVPRTDR
ncbi:MAG TPA: septum formation initiator family protein [Opitutaceae bacterium]